MVEYFFEYNLEDGNVSTDTFGSYGLRYYKTDKGIMVEIGDGYRHNLLIEPNHWNRILRVIRDDELDSSGIKAIIEGLMGACVPKEYESNLISAIKTMIIKEIE